MSWIAGDREKNGGVAASHLFGYLDIQDERFVRDALREDSRSFRFRDAVTEIRNGMLGCHSVIGVWVSEKDRSTTCPIPHVGFPSFPPIPENEQSPLGEDQPATRYFGLDILVSGKADVMSLYGGYKLLGNTARLFLCGGGPMRRGAHPLEKDPDPF